MRPSACDQIHPIEDHRDYFRLLVWLQLGGWLHAKLDACDIGQQAILLAHQRRDQFRGRTEGEWLAWLRAILANALAAAVRFRLARRDVDELIRASEEELAHRPGMERLRKRLLASALAYYRGELAGDPIRGTLSVLPMPFRPARDSR
jgi:DNA-directed RNA polymerase specialized sigma24 family protein